MPKMKTVKGVKTRFKVTGTGKMMKNRAGRRHLLGSKRAKRKRQMRRQKTLARVEGARLRSLLPYA